MGKEQMKTLSTRDHQFTVVWDEAKIVEQIEKTKRLKLYLAYGFVVTLLALGSRVAGFFG